MLRLHTFGTAHVARDGARLDGTAGQRRLVALLSVLAVHGGAGVSRDKLLALLWPEGDPERSRHALTQSLYNVRRALGFDDVLLVGGDIRLNPARIGSDVGDFATALERGDLAGAVAQYRGPFLDGFYVAQASEFERWSSEQRERFALAASRALDRLAAHAEQRGDLAGSAEWRRQRLALDPLDASAFKRLLATLAATGDVAAAVRHARAYEERLRSELDMAPPADVRTLIERLREETHAADGAREGPPEAFRRSAGRSTVPIDVRPSFREVRVRDNLSGQSALDRPDIVPPDRPRASLSPTVGSIRPTPAALLLGRRWIGGAALAVALAGSVWFARAGREAAQPDSPLQAGPERHRQTVVVAPFRVSGVNHSLRYLREGMVELLSARLADDSSARAIDPGAVLRGWSREAESDSDEVDRTAALALSNRLGARSLVIGSVVGNDLRLVLSASVVSVQTGQTVASEQVAGPTDSLVHLVDRLAARLLASDAGYSEQISVHSPPPVDAVRAFLNGQAAYRREDFHAAVRELERAVAIDSTFALAALRLAIAADRRNGAEQDERAVEIAWRHRNRLSAADQAHLVAFAGPGYPAPSSEAEQLNAWNRAATLAPDRGEVWQELGERFFFSGSVIGSVDWRSRATWALRRSLDLDPGADWSRVLLLLLAARTGDSAAIREFASTAALRDSVGAHAEFLRWRVAHALRDAGAVDAARRAMPAMSSENLRWVALSGLFDAVDVDDTDRALRLLKGRARRASDVADVLLAEHALALNMGRPVYALDVTEQLEQLQPGTGAHLRLRVLDALYGDGDSTAARMAVEALEGRAEAGRDRDVGTDGRSATRLADLCVTEQWRVWRGDVRRVSRTVATLRSAPPSRFTVPVSTPPLACAELLESMAAVAVRGATALPRVQRLDSLMLTGPAIGDAATFAPLVVSRLYDRLGRAREALAAVRRRPYMSGWPRYLATARREEGRLARRLQEHDAATDVLRRYLALRRPEGDAPRAIDAEVRSLLPVLGDE